MSENLLDENLLDEQHLRSVLAECVRYSNRAPMRSPYARQHFPHVSDTSGASTPGHDIQ